MAIRRVHTKPAESENPRETSNSTTQSHDPQRLQQHCENFRSYLRTAEDTDELARALISQRTAKHLAIFYLDEEHRLLAYTILTDGPLSLPMISQRELFQRAFDTRASAIMLAHHHPEGTASSIPEDIETLRQWRDAGRILEISILDVVIITEHDFVSLKDHLSRSFTEPHW